MITSEGREGKGGKQVFAEMWGGGGGGGGGRGPGPPTFRVIKESSLEGSFATVRANYNRDMLRMQEMAFYSIIFPNFLGLPLDFQNARAFRGAHKIPPSSIGITPPAPG